MESIYRATALLLVSTAHSGRFVEIFMHWKNHIDHIQSFIIYWLHTMGCNSCVSECTPIGAFFCTITVPKRCVLICSLFIYQTYAIHLLEHHITCNMMAVNIVSYDIMVYLFIYLHFYLFNYKSLPKAVQNFINRLCFTKTPIVQS